MSRLQFLFSVAFLMSGLSTLAIATSEPVLKCQVQYVFFGHRPTNENDLNACKWSHRNGPVIPAVPITSATNQAETIVQDADVKLSVLAFPATQGAAHCILRAADPKKTTYSQVVNGIIPATNTASEGRDSLELVTELKQINLTQLKTTLKLPQDAPAFENVPSDCLYTQMLQVTCGQ